MKTIVGVTSGDVTRIPSAALVTAINSGGAWFGGIDGAIMRIAGDTFHKQAAAAMPLTDGQTIIAKRPDGTGYSFQNVIFVVDDLQRKLREIIHTGLKAADDAGCESVTLPTIRMGVMLGVVEKNVAEAITEMVKGVEQFVVEGPRSVKSITFVVYNDEATANNLRVGLQQVGL